MKIRVQVCTGMFCSMDGGGPPLGRALQQALTDAGVMEHIEMWSAHCMGACESGPCVRINGDKHYHISIDDVPRLVNEEILPLIGQE